MIIHDSEKSSFSAVKSSLSQNVYKDVKYNEFCIRNLEKHFENDSEIQYDPFLTQFLISKTLVKYRVRFAFLHTWNRKSAC